MAQNTFRSIKVTITLWHDRPSLNELMQSPILVVAFGFGAGLAPKFPGTVGTLVALPLWWALSNFDPVWYLITVGFGFILGIWVCGRASAQLGQHDHTGIVIDEIVGYLLALAVVPFTLWGAVFSFVIFRMFDILKPWPISWLDRHVPGGLGIMLDDLVAGIFTALVVIAARAWVIL